MVKPRLVLLLGDQLSDDVAALREADPHRDVVVMAEVVSEATYVRHHPRKIAFVFAAMRKFAAHLEGLGWRVAYRRLDDDGNRGSLAAEMLARAEELGATEVIATEPGEWRVAGDLSNLPLRVRVLPDDRFFCSVEAFAAWAKGRKALRMDWFYRDMRRRTGLLMEGGKPAGGRWNYDTENRRRAEPDLFRAEPPVFEPDAATEEVLDLVEDRFGDHFGQLRPFGYATDRRGALKALDHFVTHRLATFGTYQDAMLDGDPHLSHSVLSPYLNVGLLSPREVCAAAETAWKNGRAPLNSAEGFIRQILGWREFVRGVYFLEGPDYAGRNALGHRRRLPAMYWGEPTRMACIGAAVRQTRDLAYAHHIQRLMVTGNFALLAGVDPAEVHRWYLQVYVDAYEWVEAPNTVGMSQFADGGVVASKPYVSSGAYIDRMSDYCAGCGYRVKDKAGPDACPFNLLYWHFLDRHRARFEGNSRMKVIYRNWDRMDDALRSRVLADAAAFLDRLGAGEAV